MQQPMMQQYPPQQNQRPGKGAGTLPTRRNTIIPPSTGSDTKAQLEAKLVNQSNQIIDALLDLNVNTGSLMVLWDQAVNTRTNLLKAYGHVEQPMKHQGGLRPEQKGTKRPAQEME